MMFYIIFKVTTKTIRKGTKGKRKKPKYINAEIHEIIKEHSTKEERNERTVITERKQQNGRITYLCFTVSLNVNERNSTSKRQSG